MSVEAVAKPRRRVGVDHEHESYKWWALSCTSLGMLVATINSGTLIIALPDLERSLHTTLLELVWVILVYMIASTVLVLSAGRLSDQFGRKRAYVVGLLAYATGALAMTVAQSLTAVTVFWAMVRSIACTMFLAASSQPMYSNIMTPERMTEPGFTWSRPA